MKCLISDSFVKYMNNPDISKLNYQNELLKLFFTDKLVFPDQHKVSLLRWFLDL